MFSYAFGDLLKDTGGSLILGILIGGAIAFFLPADFIHTYMGTGLRAMLIMLVVGIPMYVCATASIPIAAALMIKGINPGAAFVFLVAGPATNIVTMMVVAKNLGKKSLLIYLGAIICGSVGLGALLDVVYSYFNQIGAVHLMPHQRPILPDWASISTSVLLVLFIFLNYFKNTFKTVPSSSVHDH